MGKKTTKQEEILAGYIKLQLETAPMRDASKALLDDMSRGKQTSFVLGVIAIFLSFIATQIFAKLALVFLGVVWLVAYLMNQKTFMKTIDFVVEAKK